MKGIADRRQQAQDGMVAAQGGRPLEGYLRRLSEVQTRECGILGPGTPCIVRSIKKYSIHGVCPWQIAAGGRD